MSAQVPGHLQGSTNRVFERRRFGLRWPQGEAGGLVPRRRDQNRQMAVKEMAGSVDLLLVIGSPNSSNSMRLVEVAQAVGVRAYLIDDISEIDPRCKKRYLV